MHVRQNFHFARIFSPCKTVEVACTLSPLVTGKKQLNLSFLWHLHVIKTKKNQNKVSNSRNWNSIHFPNIFQWLQALAINCRNAWSLKALVIQNKTGSIQITASSPTPLTPCISTIKDMETLINKVQDFPIWWDKYCAEYKSALKKKLVLARQS